MKFITDSMDATDQTDENNAQKPQKHLQNKDQAHPHKNYSRNS